MIALCIIARDEADLLPGLLGSVAGVADQIVLVDTGSTDGTPDLVRAAFPGKVTVVDHRWDDDFAAARNAALPAVREPWILILDADERLAPGAGDTLRRALGGPDSPRPDSTPAFDCALLPLHNADRLNATPAQILSGVARQGEPVLLARLFRRDPDLRWEGVIHESAAAWLQGRRTARIDAPILHLGYAPELRIARNKHARNLPLLRTALAHDPANPLHYSYLARELLMLDPARHPKAQAEAAALLATGWDALSRWSPARPLPPITGLVTLHTQQLITDGHVTEALNVLAAARTLLPSGHPNLDWLEARCCLWLVIRDRSGLSRGIAALERSLIPAGTLAEPPVEGVGSWRSRLDLGYLLLLAGNPAGALTQFRAAQADPSLPAAMQPELRLAALEARIDQMESAALEEVLREPLSGDTRSSVDLLALKAMTLRAIGETAEAGRLRYRALVTRGFTAVHRQYRLQAQLCEDRFCEGQALAGPGLCGMLVRLLTKPEVPGAALDRTNPEFPDPEFPDPEFPAPVADAAIGRVLAAGQLDLLDAALNAASQRGHRALVDTVAASLGRHGMMYEPAA